MANGTAIRHQPVENSVVRSNAVLVVGLSTAPRWKAPCGLYGEVFSSFRRAMSKDAQLYYAQGELPQVHAEAPQAFH